MCAWILWCAIKNTQNTTENIQQFVKCLQIYHYFPKLLQCCAFAPEMTRMLFTVMWHSYEIKQHFPGANPPANRKTFLGLKSSKTTTAVRHLREKRERVCVTALEQHHYIFMSLKQRTGSSYFAFLIKVVGQQKDLLVRNRIIWLRYYPPWLIKCFWFRVRILFTLSIRFTWCVFNLQLVYVCVCFLLKFLGQI